MLPSLTQPRQRGGGAPVFSRLDYISLVMLGQGLRFRASITEMRTVITLMVDSLTVCTGHWAGDRGLAEAKQVEATVDGALDLILPSVLLTRDEIQHTWFSFTQCRIHRSLSIEC